MEVIDALMPLSKIDIGHDNSGAGPGWHLDRVNILAIHERTQVFTSTRQVLKLIVKIPNSSLHTWENVLNYYIYKFEQVMINCPSAGMEQWFLCNKWLATGEGDGLIERELYEAVSMRKIRKKREYLNCITCTFP